MATVSESVYRMPQTATYYATSGGLYKFHDDAVATAAATIDVSSFDVIAIAHTRIDSSRIPGSQFYWGGLATLGGSQIWLNGDFSFYVLAHEIGHCYGLPHANLWQVTDGNPISPTGTSLEYGDTFDVMGGRGDRTLHFNPLYKYRLGWLTGNRIVEVINSGTYRLHRFDVGSPSQDQTLALRVRRDGVRTYWLGFRRPSAVVQSLADGIYAIRETGGISNSLSLD